MTAIVARRTKAEQTEATTERLLAVARRMFAEHGFARTATEDIVVAAEVTRGALYHHFRNKEALFEEVFVRLQIEIGARIAQASAPDDDMWAQIAAGCRAFLETACDPDVGQIVLRDGPAVLGADAWRRADERYAASQLRRSLHELNAHRGTDPIDAEAMTVLLNGALNEAALWIAEAADRTEALARADCTFKRLIAPLR